MKKYTKILILFIIIILTCLVYTGCKSSKENTKPNIITTLFPQYDFVRQIAGDKVNVTLLLSPGTESHTYDPSPKDVININKSDVFVYTGEEMEPWAAKIISGLDSNTKVVNLSDGITLLKTEHDEEEEAEGNEEHDHESDPHIWLDPTNCIIMVDNITKTLCEIDAANETFYRENAEKYKAQLTKLDQDIALVVANGNTDTLVFGGRFSYLYFLEKYNLSYVTVYHSCSTNSEPSVKEKTNVIDYIEQNDVTVIFHEELVDPKIANSIANDTKIQCLLFSTAHNVTKDELDNGVTFINIMYQNLANIKLALGE